ncbi:unnamed protein product, partial [Leptidea sinapis]
SVARSAALAVGSRLSEARGAAAATYCALLEALVDQHVLEVVTTLVDEELERGWWDSALESSCVVMADGQGGTEALQRVFAICWSGRTTAVVERMLLPMLRHSQRALCEEFYSNNLDRLLSELSVKYRAGGSRAVLRARCLAYTRAFLLLTTLFETVGRAAIQSSRS